MSARDKYIRAWIDKAEQDRRAMEVLMADSDPLPEIACFHAQQCVEKYLKAFLTAHDRHVEKTHDLSDILSTCREIASEFGQWEDLCAELTPFAVHLRYPGIAAFPLKGEGDHARRPSIQNIHTETPPCGLRSAGSPARFACGEGCTYERSARKNVHTSTRPHVHT